MISLRYLLSAAFVVLITGAEQVSSAELRSVVWNIECLPCPRFTGRSEPERIPKSDAFTTDVPGEFSSPYPFDLIIKQPA